MPKKASNGNDRARTMLAQEAARIIVEHGIQVVVEIGSGKVLSGLMRRFDKSVGCLQVGDPESLAKTVTALKENYGV